jgi:hypothetical protein
MKKIVKIIIGLLVIGVAWYLLSPLFINKTVDESLPVEDTASVNEEPVTPAEEPEVIIDDIIIGNDVVMDEPMMEMKPEMLIETRGSFVGADSRHQGEGVVKVIKDNGKTFLRFEDFSVTNGPDLFVTLNKGTSPKGEHIIIDALKGKQGNQNYDISEYTLDDYQSVSVYCRAFSVEFATAQL